jgi:hypothetical protein
MTRAIIVRRGQALAGGEHRSDAGVYDRQSEESVNTMTAKILAGNKSAELAEIVKDWLINGDTYHMRRLNADAGLWCEDIHLLLQEVVGA